MAIFDKNKKAEGPGKPVAPAAPIENPELYTQTVSMMANLLISNTATMLGKVPHPDTGQTFRNLDAAELMIEMLQTLKQKSSGRLPPEAQDQIGRAISDLQMLYVEEASIGGDFSKAKQMQDEAVASEKAVEASPAASAASKPEPSATPSVKKDEPVSDKAKAEEEQRKVKFSKKYD